MTIDDDDHDPDDHDDDKDDDDDDDDYAHLLRTGRHTVPLKFWHRQAPFA